jgi:hypothetical protein
MRCLSASVQPYRLTPALDKRGESVEDTNEYKNSPRRLGDLAWGEVLTKTEAYRAWPLASAVTWVQAPDTIRFDAIWNLVVARRANRF